MSMPRSGTGFRLNGGQNLLTGVTLAFCVVGLPKTAVAQTTAPEPILQADADHQAGEKVDEIVVTATRRPVNLQKVAATVEALPASSLNALGVSNVLQLTSVVPGLEVVPAGGNNIYLRGVGSNSSGYNEAQVAVYIDGLYLANPALGIYSFNNIDQVEVLKGPQGTLYGRNVTAGLISVTTREPGDKPRLDASLGYANYNTFSQNLYASLPLTDTLRANVAVYHSKQSNGWGRNLFTSNDIFKSKETGVETKMVWEANSATKVTGTFIYDTNNRDYGANFLEVPGTIANDGTTAVGHYNVLSRVKSEAPFTGYISILKVQHDLGFANLTSLTGYQTSRQRLFFPANIAQLGQPIAGQGTTFADLREGNRTWSQELQLASKPSESRFDWLTGVFYYNDKTHIDFSTFGTCVGNVCAPGPAPATIYGRPTTQSYSGFADASYRFFAATHLTVGLRYTDETKGLSGTTTPLAGFPNSVTALPASTVIYPGQPFVGNPSGIPTKLHYSRVTYRLVLAQDIGHDIHLYVSDNLGFKAGAFNANSFSNPPVEPETLHAYEAGIKTELLARRLRLNVAYFHYNFKNVQLRSTAPPAPAGVALLQNIAAERQEGVDAGLSFVATPELTINGGLEILDAKYVKFPGGSCAAPGPSRIVNGVVLGSIVSVACDLSGNKVAYASPFTSTLGFSYTHQTRYGGFNLVGSFHHDARHPISADGSIVAPTADLLDASLTWTATDKRYDVRLFVKNATNVYTYLVGAVVANGFAYTPGAPRQFGATLGFHY